MNENSLLREIFSAAIAAVEPCQAVHKALRLDKNRLLVSGLEYDLDKFQRIVVVGAGKATASMALGVEQILGSRITTGLIIIKTGNMTPLNFIQLNFIRQIEASHPIPNQAGVEATKQILELARLADKTTLFICLLSGGASALLVAPVAGVSLAEKQEVTHLLLNAGANIAELNAVRKHLSAVKGGRLAQLAYPAQCLTLILSDVIGNAPDVIASGPMTVDLSTYSEACSVIAKYHLQQRLSSAVVRHLQRGMAGDEPETAKPEEHGLQHSPHLIIAGLDHALNAAQAKCQQLGIATHIIQTDLQGEARDAARLLAQTARTTLSKMQKGERRCLLSGGETTVTVKGTGIGGRNQELALAFAIEIAGLNTVNFLSVGTDGNDGNNDAAGAIVTGVTVSVARQFSLEPIEFLINNDSYHFFQQLDAVSGEHSHMRIGLTGTNVMDMQIMLLDKPH